MSFGKANTLNTGASIPQVGLGTWQSKPNEVENAVEIAVRNGYRHLDLARVYDNQEAVGRALKKVIPSVVSRQELFITSKLWNTSHQPSLVETELNETLQQLGLDYLDLYLIHWPVAFLPGKSLSPVDKATGEVALDTNTSVVDTWKALVKLQKTGKARVKAIGVSNFTIAHLQGIIDSTGVVPAVNQVEAHPLLSQDDLVAYCAEKGIRLVAYSPLGNNLIGVPRLTEHPAVQSVAKKLGATPAQVLIAWGVHRGYSVIPKSVKEGHIISNFKQIELTKEDYDRVSAIGHGNARRYNIPATYDPKWDIDVFGDEEEKGVTYSVNIG